MLTNTLAANRSTDTDAGPWQACLSRIQQKIGGSTYETWFSTTEMEMNSGGEVCIRVPNRFFADFIEVHFRDIIKEALSDCEIPFTRLSFLADEKDWQIIEPLTRSITQARESRIKPSNTGKPFFHPNYSFEAFIVGDSNRMAHAAALATAEAPGKSSFNPLIIYGGTGLGKTHLLQAIGHFAQSACSAESIVYLTSEEFTNKYINYVIERKDSTSFYKKFHDVDLLLLDDIQFFSGKHGTQKEFFRIFNKLLLENKQIVLTSDRAPDKIPDMMAHIINRFMGGMISDIQPPSLETRMAILRKKAETDGIVLADNVIEYLAHQITNNVRELEGMLIKLIASCSFTGRDITLDVARQVCCDVINRRTQKITIRHIQQVVAQHFSLSPHHLTAHSRKRHITTPRYIAMYLCSKLTKQSLRTIGLDFGGRDYSTVIHACKKIEAQLAADCALQEQVSHLNDLLYRGGDAA
ncbi:MAG: chromosomal replication initiator protein DnaA [Chitinivibrionales bacterium]|nr:chromosomal replication initiator protein DnaA [Chitinivibrionales bacterium]